MYQYEAVLTYNEFLYVVQQDFFDWLYQPDTLQIFSNFVYIVFVVEDKATFLAQLQEVRLACKTLV